MGYALAMKALELGANVTLISGPVNLPEPLGANTIQVQSAVQMHAAVMNIIDQATIFIGCAAVADYRVADVPEQKIKSNDTMTVNMIKNPDILFDVALPHPLLLPLALLRKHKTSSTTLKTNLSEKNSISSQRMMYRIQTLVLTRIKMRSPFLAPMKKYNSHNKISLQLPSNFLQ